MPVSLAFLGRKIPKVHKAKKPATREGGSAATRKGHHGDPDAPAQDAGAAPGSSGATGDIITRAGDIRLIPRHDVVSVLPDDFARNRNAAMAKVPSSRLEHFRHNYGGYIPTTLRITATRHRKLSPNDYKDFLRGLHCDHLDTVFRLDESPSSSSDSDEEEKKREEREKQWRTEMMKSKQEEYQKMTGYTPGAWNPGIGDFLEDIEKRGNISVNLDDQTLDLPPPPDEPHKKLSSKLLKAKIKAEDQNDG
jgi:hypothetical protein